MLHHFIEKYSMSNNQTSFSLIKLLGSGTFGRVYATSCGRAIKIFKSFCQLYQEYLFNRLLYCVPGIVKFHGVVSNKGIIMPLYMFSLASFMRIKVKDDPNWKESIVYQTLRTLAHLHVRNVSHGDVKPQNILINIDNLGHVETDLADFGNMGFNSYKHANCSSIREPYAEKYLLSGDLYSLGIIILFLYNNFFMYTTDANKLEIYLSQISDPKMRNLTGQCLFGHPNRRADQLLKYFYGDIIETPKTINQLTDIKFDSYREIYLYNLFEKLNKNISNIRQLNKIYNLSVLTQQPLDSNKILEQDISHCEYMMRIITPYISKSASVFGNFYLMACLTIYHVIYGDIYFHHVYLNMKGSNSSTMRKILVSILDDTNISHSLFMYLSYVNGV